METSLALAEGQLGLLGRVLLKGGDCLWLDRLSGKVPTKDKRKGVSGSFPGGNPLRSRNYETFCMSVATND